MRFFDMGARGGSANKRKFIGGLLTAILSNRCPSATVWRLFGRSRHEYERVEIEAAPPGGYCLSQGAWLSLGGGAGLPARRQRRPTPPASIFVTTEPTARTAEKEV